MNERPDRSAVETDRDTLDEGGLRAPPELKGWRKAWWWFDFIILVKLARLRFIAVLVAIGAIITQWDTLAAYYDKWTRPADSSAAVSGEFEWFCPMHPTIVRDTNKEKCPICFMPLAKRKKGDVRTEALPAGVVNRVQLSPYRVVLAGVQTWPVDYLKLTKQISAVGFVEFNERGQRKVAARTKGRLDQLFVNETGQMVDAGDLLASLYSPELNVTMQNLLDARRANDEQLVAGARKRLELLGVDDDQIDAVLRAGQANSHVRIRSPIGGHVITKYVQEGQYVEEGSPLYDVADLSTVWIQAQVYEDDLAFLPAEQAHKPSGADFVGPEVTAVTRAFADEPFHGRLTFIYPHVDQDTRTVTVRCELSNPGHKLRPGATATVYINVSADKVKAVAAKIGDDPERAAQLKEGSVLAVPETAVIDTGSQTIVYRETSPDVFEGVLVELGPKMTGPDQVTFFPVFQGLSAGERVVTAGSFLVDAETRLNPAAGSIYFGGGGAKGGSVTTVRPSTPEDPDRRITDSLSQLAEADRAAALLQGYCPILSDSRLGSMGPPIKVVLDGQTVFLCCDNCKAQAQAKPSETLTKTASAKQRTAGEKSGARPTATPAVVSSKESSPEAEAKIAGVLAALSTEDRALATAQKFCVVRPDLRLGSMGPPLKLTLDGKPVFLCCAACKAKAESDPKTAAKRAEELREIGEALSKLGEEDRKSAERQRWCVVQDDSPLGSMGVPLKLMVDGKPVFICCEGCRSEVLDNPAETLKKLEQLKNKTSE